jgi:hypothetical protein
MTADELLGLGTAPKTVLLEETVAGIGDRPVAAAQAAAGKAAGMAEVARLADQHCHQHPPLPPA